MDFSPTDIVKANTIIHYPSIRISNKLKTDLYQTQFAIVEDNFAEEERVKLLHKINTGLPLQLLKKKPGVFATALVHEVRNPLTNIKLAADILGLGNLDEEQVKFVAIIDRGIERINKILADFLRSQNEEEIHAESCFLNELLDEVLAVNTDRIALKKVSVIRDYAIEDLKVLAKKEELKIALVNIIVNAIEAMSAEKAVLKLKTRLQNNQCIIEIEDNGAGISEKNLANIFDPYFTNKPGGMGLGLSTTLDILLSNCGTMDVQSEEGSGTRFTLYFNKMGMVYDQNL
jgi:signal transduction histidine kinase